MKKKNKKDYARNWLLNKKRTDLKNNVKLKAKKDHNSMKLIKIGDDTLNIPLITGLLTEKKKNLLQDKLNFLREIHGFDKINIKEIKFKDNSVSFIFRNHQQFKETYSIIKRIISGELYEEALDILLAEKG